MNPCRFRSGSLCVLAGEHFGEVTVTDTKCVECQAAGAPSTVNLVVADLIMSRMNGVPATSRDWSMKDLPCVHRGAELRVVTCHVCGDKGAKAKVYECEIHGACIRAATNNGDAPPQHCVTCDDRTEVVSIPCPQRMCQQPKISIVMPAYQAERFITRAIQSVVDQTFKAWELVVVDDGSTDQTFMVASAFAAKDARVRAMRKPNGGTGSALNAGFKEVADGGGELQSWWSADSWMEPGMLDSLCHALELNPDVGFVYGDYAIYDHRTGEYSECITPEFDHHRHQSRCEIGVSWMWRKWVKDACGEYAKAICEDFDMHLRMADVTRFKRVPGNHGFWTVHDANLSHECEKNGWKVSTQIAARHKWAKAEIKVVSLHPWLDAAGVGWWLTRGMNESRHSIAVRHVLKVQTPILQRTDLLIGQDDAEIRRVLDQCDVIHANTSFDFDLRPWIAMGKTIIWHDHSGPWATQADKLDELRAAGATFLSCQPGIKRIIPDAEFVPNPIPLDPTGFADDSALCEPLPEWLDLPFAVSCQHCYGIGKGAEVIAEALENIERFHGIEMRSSVVADFEATIPIREHLTQNKQFPVVIDQLTHGLAGMVSWFSLAQGAAVLCRLDEYAVAEYRRVFDGSLPPIINVRTPAELIVELVDLYRNPDRLREVRKASREWGLRFYSQDRLLDMWEGIYRHALAKHHHPTDRSSLRRLEAPAPAGAVCV